MPASLGGAGRFCKIFPSVPALPILDSNGPNSVWSNSTSAINKTAFDIEVIVGAGVLVAPVGEIQIWQSRWR